MWHKLALSYQQPRMAAYFRLSSPAAAASPAAAVLGVLWLRLVEEALAEDAYLAGECHSSLLVPCSAYPGSQLPGCG